ncbi:MAG: inositol monophosphatase family protein [Pirellulaceae bacterium]
MPADETVHVLDFAHVAEQAARTGGRVLMDLLGRAKVREKGPKDLVTEADTTAQRVIREIVLNAFPGHDFLGEETPLESTLSCDSPGAGVQPRWIVDPLDGTANYVHGLPGFAVSIGLELRGKVIAGVVYDPRLDECYMAASGCGAFLNGRRLRTSACERLSQAMVAASFPPNIDRSAPDIPRFVEILVRCHSLRRLGSAALNLCYVASGRLDAYWTTGCKAWDVAAGVLMVSEAGGVVTDIDGGELRLDAPVLAVASTVALHAEFVGALALERA